MKKVCLDMSATIVHHGHIRLIKAAKTKYPKSELIIALTSDEEIIRFKGYVPELKYEFRKEIIESIREVDRVVCSPWEITQSFLDQHDIDILVHGNDNVNVVDTVDVLPRTEGVSSTEIRERAFHSLVSKMNVNKKMYTPGPAQLSADSLLRIRPVFGRGDSEYERIEEKVLNGLLNLTSKKKIVRLQGGSTNGIEVAMVNFLAGRVLFIDSGYYSKRAHDTAKSNPLLKDLEIYRCTPKQLTEFFGESFDWIFISHSETGDGWKFSEQMLEEIKLNFSGAKFMFDSTASINLEEENISDVQCFSSCKGLGGLTGAAFIAYDQSPASNRTLPFTLDINTYENKLFTGPYHAICSLEKNIENLEVIHNNVRREKEKFISEHKENLIHSLENQPLISTKISKEISQESNSIYYRPRSANKGESVVCHFNRMFK